MKGLKTHIIKFSAFSMGIIYLLMPIHKEVKSVLHSLSHSIETLVFLEHHDHDHDHGHSHNGHSKSELAEATVPHHEHQIIDILDYFMDASDHHKDSKKSNKFEIKMDKHFRSPKYLDITWVFMDDPLVNDVYSENIKDGFYSKIKIPPKGL